MVLRIGKLYIIKGFVSKCENVLFLLIYSEIVHHKFFHTTLYRLEKMSKNYYVSPKLTLLPRG